MASKVTLYNGPKATIIFHFIWQNMIDNCSKETIVDNKHKDCILTCIKP